MILSVIAYPFYGISCGLRSNGLHTTSYGLYGISSGLTSNVVCFLWDCQWALWHFLLLVIYHNNKMAFMLCIVVYICICLSLWCVLFPMDASLISNDYTGFYAISSGVYGYSVRFHLVPPGLHAIL